jgi:hypothetical protein
MYQSFRILRLVFLVIFAVVCAGLWGYQLLYVWPKRACEAKGDWWDWQDRACGIPMPLTSLTHRPYHPVQKPPAR